MSPVCAPGPAEEKRDPRGARRERGARLPLWPPEPAALSGDRGIGSAVSIVGQGMQGDGAGRAKQAE